MPLSKEIALRALFLALGTGLAYAIWGASAALGALLLGALSFLLESAYSLSRAARLRRLSRELDRILAGDEKIDLTTYKEGELSALSSQAGKMVLRLREQNSALQKEKQTLADSLADISHQLKTPLTAIDLMLSSLEGADRDTLRKIKSLTRRVEDLVSALLKLSRLDAGAVRFRYDSISVRELIDTALSPLVIPLELRGISVRVTAFEEVFSGDRQWCAEALTNLIKNCGEHASSLITVACEENAIMTQILIEDDGPGFDEGELPHLFERFYKGKSSGGAGIGLSLARAVVSAQGGTLRAENRRGGGARFIVKFYKSTM